MEYKKNMNDLTPKELGNYAQNILVTGCPLIAAIDYTPDPINDLARLTQAECEEIIRYANVLAGKEGLGKDYFNPKKARLPVYSARKPSDLEKKVMVGSAAA